MVSYCKAVQLDKPMDKFSFITLWDRYRGLLTPTQQGITDLYFNLDLTISEIAEQKGVSRQAVSDCLKGCKKQLEEYEEKLRFCRALDELCLQTSFILTDAGRWAEQFKTRHPETAGEIEPLEKILNKDYADEVSAALENPETRELLRKDYTLKAYGRPKTGEE